MTKHSVAQNQFSEEKSPRSLPRALRRAIETGREALIDLDLQVDDARHDVDVAVEGFRSAVRERARCAVHLYHLTDLANDAFAVADLFEGAA